MSDQNGIPLAEPKFPLDDKAVIDCVVRAKENLRKARFGEWQLADLNPGTQIVCGIFHELIVKEFTVLCGWRSGTLRKELDVVSECEPGHSFEVKTSKTSGRIASNRYSPEVSNPDCYYLCVNFDPRDLVLYRVKAGYVRKEAWKPQSGKGNAASMKSEALENLKEFYGAFLLDAPTSNLPNFGPKAAEKLSKEGIKSVNDIFSNYEQTKPMLNRKQNCGLLKYARRLRKNGLSIPETLIDKL